VTGHTQPPSFEKSVARALKNLDIVFYQSQDLLDESAHLPGMDAGALASGRHIVLPRGVLSPPALPREAIRQRLRQEWGIDETQTLVMSIGRIDRDKGVFELAQALAMAITRNPHIRGVLVGANPALDASEALQKTLAEMPGVRRRVRILPACPADHVWEYLCAADVFAFASRHEGMPNSLLEAMAMGVASVACAIPPVTEIDAGTGALVLVPPREPAPLAEALLRLAAAPAERAHFGALGRSQVLERFMVRKNTAVALAHLANLVSMKSMGERAVRG
jgi:glycosyltransferase involved in cell wall biosynthesis